MPSETIRSIRSYSLLTVLALIATTNAHAQPVLVKDKRLAWDVVGLDSNDETDGPDVFPVGRRICNTGDMDATNVTAELQWQTANAFIDLAAGSAASLALGTITPGSCVDAYYNIQVARNASAYDTARQYLIEIDSDQTTAFSDPIDAANYNEIYIERLISQNRNLIDSILGPTTVYQGQTYMFTLNASTATNGYQQLQSFINFPNNIFRIVSVAGTYTADFAGTTDDAVYSDACGWVHDPEDNSTAGDGVWYFTNGTNSACASSDKEGGDVTLVYAIEIVGTGSATVTALIHDFSGSSFHYNSDYGSDVLSITALPQPTLSVADVAILEGDAGLNSMVFTVTMSSARSDMDVMFNYGTTGITAASGTDFTATSASGTITAGTTSTTITVPITTETIYELDETFQLDLSNPVGAILADGTAVGTIQNDDSVPAITVGDASITEGGSLVFTLSLSNQSYKTIAGSVGFAAGTASLSDFDGTAQNFLFPVGMTTTTVTVPTTDDMVVESSEQMTISVSAISAGTATGVGNSATGTINDNDTPPPPPDVAIGDATIGEGGTLMLPVSLSATATETIAFNVNIVAGGSASGSDYTVITMSVTINAGSSSGVINVDTTDDLISEGNETVVVGVGTITQGSLGDTSDTGIGTITDNDGVPNLSGLDAGTVEGGNLSFNISLSNPSASSITVNYSTVPGTASVSDYTTTTSSVTFLPGQTSQTITIPSTVDNIDELTEMFTLSLTSSDSVNILDSSLTGTITDDDGAPGITIGDASITEGGDLLFPVMLSNPSSGTIELQLGTMDGTAEAVDYDNSGGSVTFAPGVTSQNFTVSTLVDLIDELDETFILSVASVSQGNVGDTSDTGTGTILDDDGAPALTIGDVSVGEGGNLIYPISLSNPSATDITVTFRPSNGTASAGDYANADVQITIPAGSTTGAVSIATVGDLIDESDETVILSVQSVDAGALSDVTDTGTGTIIDDDGAPSVTIDDVIAIEGNTLMFTVALSGLSSEDVTLQLGTINGTASSTDYTTTPFSVTIPAGMTSVTASVATVDDAIDESDETMTLFVSSVTAGIVADFSDTGEGTIQDDDGAPSVAIDDVAVVEGGLLIFPVTLSNPSMEDITLEFTPTNLTASISDYDNTPVQITISAGSVMGSVAIPTTSDLIDEMDETVQLGVSNVVSGVVGDTMDTGVGTITDDDMAPDIVIGDASVVEGGDLSFPVTLSNPSMEPIVLTFQPSNGTAMSDDYSTSPVQITIPPGSTSGTVIVSTITDILDESNETLTLAVASVDSGSVGDSSDIAIGTIIDDDGAPSLAIGDASIGEGGDLLFPLALSNSSAEDITITLTPMGITASGTDFVGTPVQVTIPSGMTTASAVVSTVQDAVAESDETLSLGVTSVDAGSLSDSSDTGTGTIVDDDGGPDVNIGDTSIGEGGILSFPVTLSEPSTEDIVLTFQPVDGSATSADYVGTPNQITIPAGSTMAVVAVSTLSDALDEANETINIFVSSVDSGPVGDASDTAVGTIIDDDGAPSLDIGDASSPEGSGLVFPITLSNPSPVDITITLTPSGVTADGMDFVGTPVQVTIPAGQIMANVVVPTNSDSESEPDETLILTVTSVDAGSLGDTSDTGVGTILDFSGEVTGIPVLGGWGLTLLGLLLSAIAGVSLRVPSTPGWRTVHGRNAA